MAKLTKKQRDAAAKALNEAAKRQKGKGNIWGEGGDGGFSDTAPPERGEGGYEAPEQRYPEDNPTPSEQDKKRASSLERARRARGGKSHIGRGGQSGSGSGKGRVNKDDTIGGKYRGSDR
jgi:hypothetical protein